MTVGPDQPSTRRQFLKGVGALAALGGAGGGVGYEVWRSFFRGGVPASSGRARAAAPTLEDFARNIMAGGPGKDGIPSIDHPRFVSASAARFLRDEDPVFGLVYRGEVRAYPQPILVWHEIVNDTVAGERLAVTYCPLTGSVVAFKGTARGRSLTFGTTGNRGSSWRRARSGRS